MTGQSFDVELRDVTKSFGEFVAVDGVSFQVQQGEFLTLLGPSGCGKTTTLRMIGGFATPDGGQVLIQGQEVNQLPPAKRNTSMVFQDYALFPHMTVRENIAFGLKIRGFSRGEIKTKTEEALQLVNLPQLGNRKPNQLSGGQKQRVALARSLVLQPAVLLLDEPLGALDAQIRKHMQLELKNLQQNLGQTFIYVTHDQEEALTMSDKIAIMRNGKIEQLATPREVYENPLSPFVASFLGECNFLEGTITRKGSAAEAMFNHPKFGSLQGRLVNPGLARDNAPAVFCLRPENLTIHGSDDLSELQGTSLPGIVKQVVYGGSLTRYVMDVGNQDLLVETLGNEAGLEPGTQVVIGWQREKAFILPQNNRAEEGQL